MKLIVGLGNPGFRYRNTRHNVGFMVVDGMASRGRIRLKKRLFHSLCGDGAVVDEKVLLAKPFTYMNLSGRAVSELVGYAGITLKDLMVVVDDAELELGKIRLRPKGSAGGHNGLRSIIEDLGTEDFPRLRIGIGSAGREGELRDYVLAPFKRSERDSLREALDYSRDAIETWLKAGLDIAMARFNS